MAVNFDNSELQIFVLIILSSLTQFLYIFTKAFIEEVLSPPIKTLLGLIRSFIAVPSAKNSGFDKTEKDFDDFFSRSF